MGFVLYLQYLAHTVFYSIANFTLFCLFTRFFFLEVALAKGSHSKVVSILQ